MLQLSKLILIFASWVYKNPRHRGERLSFDPLENLENSTYTGIAVLGDEGDAFEEKSEKEPSDPSD